LAITQTNPLVNCTISSGAILVALIGLLLPNNIFPSFQEPPKKLAVQELIGFETVKAAYPTIFVAIIPGVLVTFGSIYVLSLDQNPIMLIIGQWIGIPGKIYFGRIAQSKGNRVTIKISLICLLLGIVGLLLLVRIPLISVNIALLSCGALLEIGIGGGWLSFQNIAQESALSERQTLAHTTFLLMWRLGVFIGQGIGTGIQGVGVWYYSLGLLGLTLIPVIFKKNFR
jgi:hypothetical protein